MRVGSVDLAQITAEIIDQFGRRSPRHSLRSSFQPNVPIIRRAYLFRPLCCSARASSQVSAVGLYPPPCAK